MIREEFTIDDSGELEFLCTTYLLIDDYNSAFVGSLEMPELEIGLQQANNCLRQIPDHEIYPPAPGDIAIYAQTAGRTGSIYIKRPKVGSHCRYEGSTILADRYQAEAKTHQLVHESPHQNVVQFEGCIVNRGLNVGLALKRYPLTLNSVVEEL